MITLVEMMEEGLVTHVCEPREEDGLCVVCGVDFSYPCDLCGARGFHAEDCEEADHE